MKCICMAISICDKNNFKSKLIPLFIDGDSDQLDPCFAAFKRISSLHARSYNSDNLIANLKLIDKASIRIDSLFINKYDLHKMSEFYKDKEINFMLNSLQFDNYYFNNISDEEAKFINKINPKMLTIENIKWTIENIKSLFLLNCADIDVNFDNKIVKDFYLRFIKTPIQLFDFNYNQQLTFELESIKIFIQKNKIKKINLLKANTGNFLFIPLDTIGSIYCSGLKEILRLNDTNKQFADLGFQHQFDNNGLIIHMRYSNRIFIELGDDDSNRLNQYIDIYRIFKEKHLEPTIKNLNIIFEIIKTFPDDFCSIKFRYFNYHPTEMWKHSMTRILESSDVINLKFWKIYWEYMLFPYEFQFWWEMLRSSKTRFRLTSIDLKFNFLSECLTTLSLCSGCPELEFIELKYLEEVENEDEIVGQAKREFRQKFGFIQRLTIWHF